MPEFISSDAMRALEAAAIESGAVTGADLMERAGEGVCTAIFDQWPELAAAGRAVVLCGPGNNGGDGFVVARLLLRRGWQVTVFSYGDGNRLPPDASLNRARWIALDGARTETLSFPEVSEAEGRQFREAAYGTDAVHLVIDALFGIGLTRPLKGLRPVLSVCAKFGPPLPAGCRPRHVSIDLPSGIAEAGPLGECADDVFHADLTVTFHKQKMAHRNAAEFCGAVVVCDIGLADISEGDCDDQS